MDIFIGRGRGKGSLLNGRFQHSRYPEKAGRGLRKVGMKK